MMALTKALQQRAVTLHEPPQVHNAEELDAYVKSRISELDSLIQDFEKQIEKLHPVKDKVDRAWFAGALKGLQLARSAWSWWNRSE